MIFGALLLTVVLPVIGITACVGIHHYKENKLLEIFLVIAEKSINQKIKDEQADKAINILHNNKKIPAPNPIQINIYNPDGAIVAFYLFKAEIRYLLDCIDKRRNQRKYLSSLSPRARGDVLKFIDNTKRFLKFIDFDHMDFELRSLFLHKTYRATVLMCRKIPDENNYPELDFIPLFEIVDKSPTRTVRLLPYFPT